MLKKTIIRYLLLKIQNDEININAKLPSENQLGIKFHCNRHTAAEALKELVKKDLCKSIPGSGYYLLKTFEQVTSIDAYVFSSQVKWNRFVLETFPIRLLSKFNFSNYVPKLVGNYFVNGIHHAKQYLFLTKRVDQLLQKKFVHNNFFKQLAYYGITVFELEKQVYFINNDKAHLQIKDDFIVVLKFVLWDDNINEIATFYNLISSKYFMVKRKMITL